MAIENGYGSVSGEHRNRNHDMNSSAQERGALLGKADEEDSVYIRLQKHMNVNVSKRWGDIALLSCYIITGLLDSSSVFIWGSFVSMQTGNTVYVGLGLVAPFESNRWIRSGVSIACFCAGSFVFARYHRRFGHRKRWVMVSTYFLQLVMVIISALMVTLGPETGTSGPVTIWIGLPIALIAFQAAGQAVTSRALQFNALTSVVLTSIYCDLFSDQKLFAGFSENVERNRRVAAPILTLIGAVFGGLWAHSSWGLAGALWTAAILKAFVTVAWFFWTDDPDQSQ